MGEVVLSSDDIEELKGQSEAAAEKNRGVTETDTNNDKAETNNGKDNKTRNGCSSSGAITRWDRLFPRMLMRVLLVEADDSTRQIIAALLRKCSYRGQFLVFLLLLFLLSLSICLSLVSFFVSAVLVLNSVSLASVD